MSSRTLRAIPAVMLVTSLTSCGSTDRVGEPEPAATQTLRLATRTRGDGPGAAFAAEVSDLSEGTLQIAIEHEAHRDLGRGSDVAILADVVAGTVDLGAISIESLEAAGVRSFDPLVAPGVVTSVAAEAQIAGGPVASQMLDGAASASVVGIAIVPGPIHYLAGIGGSITDPAQLTGQLFGITATATLATDAVQALGATPALDDRADTIDTGVRALDTSPQAISQRQIVDTTGHLVGNAPLWPQPTIIVANADTFGRLTEAQQESLKRAGLQSAVRQAESVIKDDEEALAVLCRSSTWTFESLEDDAAASLFDVLAGVTDGVRRDQPVISTLSDIEQLVSSVPTPSALACPNVDANSTPTSTQPSDIAGAAQTLVGTWEADVTEEALADAGVGPSETGLVGHWRITVTENGRVVIEGAGLNLDLPVAVEDDAITVTVDTGSVEEGLGEVWRYSWSVFRDKLTLERIPGPGFQAGPTSLVSQPFDRA